MYVALTLLDVALVVLDVELAILDVVVAILYFCGNNTNLRSHMERQGQTSQTSESRLESEVELP